MGLGPTRLPEESASPLFLARSPRDRRGVRPEGTDGSRHAKLFRTLAAFQCSLTAEPPTGRRTSVSWRASPYLTPEPIAFTEDSFGSVLPPIRRV
jgi:hypothetical protein